MCTQNLPCNRIYEIKLACNSIEYSNVTAIRFQIASNGFRAPGAQIFHAIKNIFVYFLKYF